MASPQRTDGSSPRTAPRDMHAHSVRPNAVHHRVAKETDASRREHRDRLVTAKRMRLQGDGQHRTTSFEVPTLRPIRPRLRQCRRVRCLQRMPVR